MSDAMSREKTMLVPKLRFPEFRGAELWESKTLAEICLQITNGKANAQDHQEDGDYPLFDRSTVIKKSSEFMFDAEAVILPGEGMRFVPKYFQGKFNLHQRAYALMRHQGDGRFVYQSLDYLQDTLAKKAVKSTVLSLRLPIVQDFVIGCPKPAEQQKIADCLSSLDELIAAQARKVDALKTHKKGLMQQLFPREGETQPRLRFPEFQNAGEWVQKTIGDVSEVLMCKRIFAEETNPSEGVPFYKIGTLGGIPDAFISREKFKDYKSRYNYPRTGEILITCSGTIGKCLPFDGNNAYFQDSNIVWLDNPTGEVSNEFLLMLLSNVNWGRLNATTITRIYGTDLRGLVIKYPEDALEQQRIASCLSTLDDLITAAVHQLETLKTHKKGLMQQLFPSAEMVEA